MINILNKVRMDIQEDVTANRVWTMNEGVSNKLSYDTLWIIWDIAPEHSVTNLCAFLPLRDGLPYFVNDFIWTLSMSLKENPITT